MLELKKNKIMRTIEITDVNEVICITEETTTGDFYANPLGVGKEIHVHCQMTGSELLDAIYLYKQTKLDMESDGV